MNARSNLVLANDFAAQWNDIGDDVLRAVDRVGRSGWLVLGNEVAQFEDELAGWWESPFAVGVASGLDALEICLRIAGVRPGDRVLTTPLTAFATTLAIIRVGAVPVWCDVDETGGLDLALADEVLGSDGNIAAVVPVHLYGHPLDPAALRSLTERYGVPIVEDCAQSAGARRDGLPTGSVGIANATSLYPTKNLGAMGDGGVVMVTSEAHAAQARRLRNYGQSERYLHVEVGMNSRLDELHAAILRSAMMPRIDLWIARRQAIADRYRQSLVGSDLRPIVPSGGNSASHLFPVEVIHRDPAVISASLTELGIAVGRHYPTLCSDMPACADVGVRVGDLATARRIAANELSLPLHPYLTDDDVERVIAACLLCVTT